LTQIKQEAVAKRPAEVDRPIVEQTRTTEKPVEDKVSSPFVDSIMSELGKF
jgi:hypothetical protein